MISVIIPAHNEEKSLPLCLDSLVNQKSPLPSHEVIVVDNHSTDNTEIIAKLYVNKLNLKVVKEPKQGVSIARNAGAKEARGSFLVFLDADNIVESDFLSIVENNSQLYEAGTFFCLPIEKTLSGHLVFLLLEFIKIIIPRPFGKSFTSKSVFQAVGGYNENITIGTNVDFLNRVNRYLLRQHKSIIHIYKPIYVSLRRFEKKGYLITLYQWLLGYLKPSRSAYPPLT